MSVLGNRPMWLFVLFDLPVTKKIERKRATQFRNALLKDGYVMIQFSIYARPCGDWIRLEKHRKRLKYMIPPQGSVRTLAITDRQFKTMEEMINIEKFDEDKKHQNCEELLLF
ncbi:MAG: CRISPR-associated endonuclease Cas2 [Brevinema sp.]